MGALEPAGVGPGRLPGERQREPAEREGEPAERAPEPSMPVREPLALLEAIDRDGLVRQAWRVEHWPVSIGRALDNDVVLSDPHVAARHAVVDRSPGSPGAASTLTVSAGATRNGIVVGRELLRGGDSKALGADGADVDLHIGRSHLRLRLADTELAPEQAMSAIVAREQRWLPTLALAVAVFAIVLFNAWIDTDPDNLARAAGAVLLTAFSVAAVWCGLWALLSKTFTRQSHFGWHVRVFLLASIASFALAALAPLFAFAFSLPSLTDFSFVAVYAAVAAAIYFHLLAVEPARARLMRAVAATGFVAGVGLTLWFNVQRTGRPGEELYMNHLFMPQLRLARPAPVDAFIAGLAPMQAILDRKAKEQAGAGGEARTGNDDEE